jgi:LmbE family N-acetylglucosaminyl deacetylase
MMDYCRVKHVSRFSFLLAAALPLSAERTPLAGAADLIQTLDRLNTLGSLLQIAAHPDDESTDTIAYFARGRRLRTAYLSATRGEGGQNLMGPEQGEALGLIRTQELLMARRIDAGEQYFTRASDFGFSKSPEEALAKWNREVVLGDLVRIIRRFRPDVVVTRWSPHDASGRHGHHVAVGHLTPVAFAAAADPQQFPALGLPPWQARRLVWISGKDAATPAVSIEAGQYDFVLGKSYAEIAAESRTQHASQGFGADEQPGARLIRFRHVAGVPARKDLFEDIDTTWGRVAGARRLGELLREARDRLDPRRPDLVLALLLDAWREMQGLRDPWTEVKQRELLHAIELAAGLQFEASADRWAITPGSSVEVTLSYLCHSPARLAWEKVSLSGVAAFTGPASRRLTVAIPSRAPYSQPHWLGPNQAPDLIGLPENPPALTATFRLRAAPDLVLPFAVPVQYRWVDHARGELSRSIAIVPPVSVSFPQPALIFPDSGPRRLLVLVKSHAGPARGRVTLDLPAGWKADPPEASFDLPERDRESTVSFRLTPPSAPGGGQVTARAVLGDATVSAGLVSIRHPHIPPQVYFSPARIRVERFDVRLAARRIGYVMGAGDDVPQALEQLGAAVHLLTSGDLAAGDLSRFDAIVTGIRAVNVREDLVAARARLLDYVAGGGTLVVQYNKSGGRSPDDDERAVRLAPYPFTPSSNRVSVEEAPVTFPNPSLSLLHRPNVLTPRDFDGWVQERGLYFLKAWDPRYQPPFACQDPGESPQLGGALVAAFGKGVYIHTAYSWFRQLPAGVPGAYRVFANLVSGGR